MRLKLQKLKTLLVLSFILMAVTVFGSTQDSADNPVGINPESKSKLNKKDILKTVTKVADWQYLHPTGKEFHTWDYAPYYHGIMELYRTSKDEKWLDILTEMGDTVRWELRPRPYDANVYAIGQTFIDLYQLKGKEEWIEKTRYTMDMPMARGLKPEVAFDDNKYWWEWWTWCDALYMAPPTYAMLAHVKNEPKYLDFMTEMWWLTSDYLYSQEDSLFFRDDRFFDLKSANGAKIFWSRGNGWVIAGLARLLPYLPEEHKDKGRFVSQFQEMSAKIAALQMNNGYWGQSLLDTQTYPEQETSGTAFFIYSLAWGVNNGYLDKDKYLPVISKGWHALKEAVNSEGKLGYVQRVGDQPDQVKKEDWETYGSGALILAGIEIYRML